MAADVAEKKSAFHRKGAASLFSFYAAAGRWVSFFFWRQMTDCLTVSRLCLYLPQHSTTCFMNSLQEKKKTKKQQSESAAWLKVAQSNIDCLLFCHPALSRLQNKHSLVSLHLCLKSTFCVPFRHTRALRQLLSLLHKWNKSPLCKKWWGHGKKGWYYFSIRMWSKYQEACKGWYIWAIRRRFLRSRGKREEIKCRRHQSVITLS